MEKSDIRKQYDKIAAILLKERNEYGFWDGELSSSALSTAVAIVAFKINEEPRHESAIEIGLNWLLNNVNCDGGFGDTPESDSNISTSLLCYAAIFLCGKNNEDIESVKSGIQQYLKIRLSIGLNC